MNRNQHNLFIVLLAMFLAGCAGVQTGQDPVVVRAEQTTILAFDVLNNFVAWERANELLVGRDVHQFADGVRRQAPGAFTSARAITAIYKANRTPENKANLLTAVAVLEGLMAEAQKYIASTVAPATPSR